MNIFGPEDSVPIPAGVTICITSCGRLDLLERTISSFRTFNSGGRYILSEDSTDKTVIATIKARYPDMEVLSGPDRLGLMGSIDRLYSHASSHFLFHLEDDWEFDGPVDWTAAMAILNQRDDVANVSVRAFSEIKERFRRASDPVQCSGAKFRLMLQSAHPEFFGWSSNPGLIKRELYETYRPFSRLMHDQMSGLIKRDGKTVAYLLPGVARHIGKDRNVTDPTMPARPKSKPAKWLRAIKKKLYYAGFRREPF